VLYISVLLWIFCFLKAYGQIKDVDLVRINSEATDFYHLNTEGGMEQNSITTVGQDSIGQMWFASKDGLLRYNGKAFFVYKHKLSNPRSIGNNFVHSIFVSKDGGVWVGSIGLTKYHPETDDFEPILPSLLSDIEVLSISQDSNGILWFLDKNSTLFRYDDTTKELRSFVLNTNDNHDVKPELCRLLMTKKDRLFITTNQPYFIEFKPFTGDFHTTYFMSESEIKTLPKFKNNALSIMEDHNGDIWLASIFGFAVKYNLEGESLTRYNFELDLSKKKYYSCMFIFEDTDTNIWIGTWTGGLLKILPNRQEFSRLMPKPSNLASITNSIITSGIQDKAGYLWFGTEFSGLNILKQNKKFSILAHNSSVEQSLPAFPYTKAIKDFKGRVWVGTDEDGLYYFNPKDKKAYKTTHPILKKPTRIFTLLNGKNDILWIGTGIGLYQYNLRTQDVAYYPRKKDNFNSLGGRNVVSLCQDYDGNIWVGTIHGGLTKLVVSSEKFYRFMPDEDNPNSLSYKYVSAIFQDSNRDIWVGTLKGLNKFNPASGSFTIFKPTQSNSISSERINCIYEKNGSLWIGTDGGGLNEYNLTTKEFRHYFDSDNPITHNIKAITSDDNNNLWLSSTHNLLKFNLESKQFINYSASDGLENEMYIQDYGLQQLQFFENFATKDSNGYLYFGGIGGLTFFHPDSLLLNSYKPPILIETFLVNGKKRPIKNTNDIVLKCDENHLEFTLTVLNFIQPDKNTYAHYLENYDSEWIYDGSSNHIGYFNLPKGKYKFHYKGTNNDGVWNKTLTPIAITILPAFYQTTGFYILLIALLLLLLLAFVFYKRYIKKKIEKQKKLSRYVSSTLDVKKAKAINEKLLARLAQDDLYLEADLSLHKLAEEIEIKPHDLSQVINQYHKKHFQDFINTYRIKAAKKLLRETALKIEAVAYDSGFNSISTFNVAFKKETELTPSKYRKKYKNSDRS